MKHAFARSGAYGFLDNSCADKQNDLIMRASRGDRAAFEILAGSYIKLIYNYINVHVQNEEDAKDILQDTMLGIWRSLKSYKGASSFKTWIIAIARRKIADFFRKTYSDKHFESDNILDMSDTLYVDSDTDKILEGITVKNAVDTLGSQEKELLYLIFTVQLSYSEIESLTNIPTGTIKSRMHAIKTKLRPLLDEGRD